MFLKGLPHRPVFMGYPAAFDFAWHHWYLVRFTGEDPCGFAPLCLKSYAAASCNVSFRDSAKRNYSQDWFRTGPAHDHTALTDDLGQGWMGIHMIRANLGLPALP